MMHPDDVEWGEIERLLDKLAEANTRDREEVKQATTEVMGIVKGLDALEVPGDLKTVMKGVVRLFEQVGRNRVAIQEMRHDHWLTTQILSRQIHALSDKITGLDQHR